MLRRALPRVAAGLLFLGIGTAAALGSGLRITAPSAPGSGWDQLGQMLAVGLSSVPDAGEVSVANVPGGSGTVGLAQFAAGAGDGDLLIVGLTMMDAILVTRSPVSLDQLSPIARLSTEPFVLAVPAASPILAVSDLRAAFLAEPGKVTLAGGPTGGVDHAAAIQLVRALDLSPRDLGYVPFLSSQEAVLAVAEERVTAVLLAAGEVAAETASGRLRAIGVAAPQRLPSAPDMPTLAEAGAPFAFANWRGLVARAGLARRDRERLAGLVERATAHPSWNDALARKRWIPAFLAGDDFASFLRSEQVRLKETLKLAGLLRKSEE